MKFSEVYSVFFHDNHYGLQPFALLLFQGVSQKDGSQNFEGFIRRPDLLSRSVQRQSNGPKWLILAQTVKDNLEDPKCSKILHLQAIALEIHFFETLF